MGLDQQMEIKEDGGLYFLDRIWIPLVEHERRMITWLDQLMEGNEYGGLYFCGLVIGSTGKRHKDIKHAR